MEVQRFKPPKTIERFMLSNARRRVIMGPFGSGKSSGCCVEIPRRAAMQSAWRGQRKTRFAVIRNTMPQLRDTTIKTWLKWFPNGTLGHWVENTRTYIIRQGDIYCEVLFRALDTPDDVAKLLSLELTGAYLNECREIPKEIVDGLDGRINRYPSRDEGGADWCGIIADTNPPTEEEYWYYIIEGMDPDTQLPVADNGWEAFIQPSGLSETAENLENLPEGYYRDLAKNKSKEYVDVYIHGKYGKSKAGKPVHPTFDPRIHVASDILVPNPRLPILISADFGLTPAMTIKQQDVFGRVLTLDEIVTQEMGLKRAIAERLKPLLKRKYEGYNVRVTGDPAGNERAQTDERSCVQIFKDAGFRRVKFAYSNNPVHRIGATDSFLTRLTEQGPAYQIDPRCSFLKRGMAGGYHYPINRRGEVADGPKKNIFSHVCFVGGTEIATPGGPKFLCDLRLGDLVTTPIGPRPVSSLFSRMDAVVDMELTDGRVLTGTPDHPIWTARGFTPIEALQYNTILTTSEDRLWNALFKLWHYAGRPNIRFSSSAGYGTTKSLRGTIKPTTPGSNSTFIEQSGFLRMARSLTATMSIIRTTISRTTNQRTLTFFLRESITRITCGCQAVLSKARGIYAVLLSRLHSGVEIIRRPRVISAEKACEEPRLFGRLRSLRASANAVARATSGTSRAVIESFAPLRASLRSAAHQAWMTRIAPVAFAAAFSALTGILGRGRVRMRALGSSSQRQRVFNVEVEGAHCYFANGILVSNCESGQYGDMYFERLEGSPDDEKDRRARVSDSHERARQQVYGRRG